MGTTAQKLQNIIDSKAAISAAIEAKGGTVPTELTGYGPAIEALPSGGSDLYKTMFLANLSGGEFSVTSADIDGLTTIRDSAFQASYELKSFEMPPTVTSIQGGATFNHCHTLSNIVLSPNLTGDLGGSAFGDCYALTSIVIPDGITKIKSSCFNYSRNLAVIDFGTTRSTIPTLENSNAFRSIYSNYQVYVPSNLLDSWKSASQWSGIASHIVAHP